MNTESHSIIASIDKMTQQSDFTGKLVPITTLVKESEIANLGNYAGIVIQVGSGNEQQLHLVQPYSIKETGTKSASGGNVLYVPSTAVVVRDKSTGSIVGIPAISGG